MFRARHLWGSSRFIPLKSPRFDLAETYVDLNRRTVRCLWRGMTQINMFFENPTRTQSSFELAGKRLGADVMNMSMQTSSVKKGETLIDTGADAERHASRPAGGAPSAIRAVDLWRKRSTARS